MLILHKTQRITNTLLDYFSNIDEHDWGALEKLFADKFVYDHPKGFGGDPLILTPQQFREMYEHKMSRYILHTQSSAYRIHLKGKAANASCYYTAYNRLKDEYAPSDAHITRIQAGTVQFHLFESGEDWKIDMINIKIRFIEEFHSDAKAITPHVTHQETLKYRSLEESMGIF